MTRPIKSYPSPTIAFAVMCLALSGCYQTPEWADPVQWAHKASYQVNQAVREIRNRNRHPGNQALAADPLSPIEAPATPENTTEPPAEMEVAAAEPEMPRPQVEDPPRAAAQKAASAPATATAVKKPHKNTDTSAAEPFVDPRSVEQQTLPPASETPKPATKKAAKAPVKKDMTDKTTPASPAETKSTGAEYAVHLASYRKLATVRKEWRRLTNAHPEHLLGLRVRVSTVDLGPPRGKYLRLKAGPLPTRDFAKKLCISLKKQGLYCAVMRFSGRQLG